MTIKKQSYTSPQLPPPPIPGEAVFVYEGSTSISWTVPENVYSISAVCVSMYYDSVHKVARILRGGTELLSAEWPIGTNGCGGGNGGPGGAPDNGGGPYGNGGAGGYSGNGGAGGGYMGNGSAGSGGGGGGGAGGYLAGGVGLLGQGANGAGAVYEASAAGNGSPSPINAGAANFGGGFQPGGNLRYLNNIPVTAGETLTIDLAYALKATGVGTGTAVRVMWGADGRSYPNNAQDAVPEGQTLIALSNTTFTVPAGVTSICACAQQQNGSSAAVTLVVGGATVLRAQNGNRLGDGGGDGGVGYSGGGGAGGYSGNGGAGGVSVYDPVDGTSSGQAGGAGAGGGGAGGQGESSYWVTDPVFGGSSGPGRHLEYISASPGGGVGISGQGTSGTTSGEPGSPDPINGYMGGGAPGQAGGALAYKNAITVTPGQVLTVNAEGGRIRIIWGPSRSYPSAAGNV